MANGLDLKERTSGREIPENDPLMELSRIMGFDKTEPLEPRLDPQIAAEDSFSMDLERELAFEEVPADGGTFDAEFAAAFEEDLSESLRFEPDAPSVVPSLEDELSALLSDASQEAGGHEIESFPGAGEDVIGYQDGGEQLALSEEEGLVALEANDEATTDWHLVADDTVDGPAFPWPDVANEESLDNELERDFKFDHHSEPQPAPALEVLEAALPGEPDAENEAGEVVFDDEPGEPAPVLVADAADHHSFEMSAYQDFGLPEPDTNTAVTPIAGDSDYSREDGFDAFLELAKLDIPPAPEFDGEATIASAPLSEPELPEDDFRGFGSVEETYAPLVDAAEPRQDEVLHTDDFEIPDFEFQSLNDVQAQHEIHGDFDDDLELAAPMPAAQPSASPATFNDADFDFDTLIGEELAAGAGAVAAGTAVLSMRGKPAVHVDANEISDPFQRDSIADDVFAPVALETPRRKPWLAPVAIAGVLALLGGGLYYAFSGDGASVNPDGPVLVKADPEPVKVAPENPGGATVANQDKAVYDKVEGDQASMPAQGALVSESEEPVDIAAVTPPAEPEQPIQSETVVAPESTAKAEDRVEAPAVENAQAPAAETAAVTPKKVRTVIVKPDGTLVERPVEAAPVAVSDPVAEVAATEANPVASIAPAKEPIAETVVPVAKSVAEPAVEDPIAQIAAVEPEAPKVAEPAPVEPVAAEAQLEPAAAEPAIKVVKAKKIKPPVVEKVADQAESVPVPADAAPVGERPADQPVNIVGKTGGQQPAAETQVASVDPAAAPAAGAYSIQIASTPSPEAAKSTYAALNRKFGGIIGGKGVNIQKANVEGKGTVYRVRIPAGSKQDAAALCSQYKSAGGSCFVTK